MFKGTKIPDENEGKPFYHLMLWNGMRVETAYRIVYVNEAELDGTHGLVIAKYTPEVIYHYSDVPESFDVNLEREAYLFRKNTRLFLTKAEQERLVLLLMYSANIIA